MWAVPADLGRTTYRWFWSTEKKASQKWIIKVLLNHDSRMGGLDASDHYHLIVSRIMPENVAPPRTSQFPKSYHVIPGHHLGVFKSGPQSSDIGSFQGCLKCIKNNPIRTISNRMDILIQWR